MIRSVSISNINNSYNLTSNSFADGALYEIFVGLNFNPNEEWKRLFRHEWIKNTIPNRRNFRLFENELRVELDKEDDIQAYIDLTQKLIKNVTEQFIKTNRTFDNTRDDEREMLESRSRGELNNMFYSGSFDV